MQLPTRRPNAEAGAALYTQKCAGCHGAQGAGDGVMAAQIQTQFGSPVSNLTADPVARAQTPEQWYSVISNGELDKGMPPFTDSLDPDQRWDVIRTTRSNSARQASLCSTMCPMSRASRQRRRSRRQGHPARLE